MAAGQRTEGRDNGETFLVLFPALLSIFSIPLVLSTGLLLIFSRASSEDLAEFSWSCSRVGTVPGPEDLVVVSEAGVSRLLVSSQPRRESPRPNGGIYDVTLETRPIRSRQLPLIGRDGCSFHPHGVGLLEVAGAGGRSSRLYVLNHHDAGDTSPSLGCLPNADRWLSQGGGFVSVEVFEVLEAGLGFLQRLVDPRVLLNGNDLVVTENGDVYVTFPPAQSRDKVLELMGRKGLSQLVRIRCPVATAERCIPRFEKVAVLDDSVNGIAMRKEEGGFSLFVAATLGKSLRRIRFDESGRVVQTAAKELVGAVPGIDNLTWWSQEPPILLAAAHSDLRRFLQHSNHPQVPSPSELWLLPIDSGRPERIFTDRGSLISAASTAVADGRDGVMLGQVFESAVLSCRSDRYRPPRIRSEGGPGGPGGGG